jgi:hypothetical protein
MAKVIEQIAISAGCTQLRLSRDLVLWLSFRCVPRPVPTRWSSETKELGFISVERDGRAQVNWGEWELFLVGSTRKLSRG